MRVEGDDGWVEGGGAELQEMLIRENREIELTPLTCPPHLISIALVESGTKTAIGFLSLPWVGI